jgi:hypothetical protein
MRQTSSTALGSFALATLLLAASQTGGYHEDARWGFKVKSPKDWEQVPLKLDENQQVAKFLSKREYTFTDDRGWSWEHRAQMVVIALPRKDGVPGFEAYEEYLGNVRGADADVIERKTGKAGDLEVTKLRTTVRGGLYRGALRLTTWVYQLEDFDLAVEFEVLEGYEKKLRKTVEGCLKSLRAIPRTGPPPGRKTAMKGPRTYAHLAPLAPEARRERRIELELDLHERASATLPEGWTSEVQGRFLVLNHSDDRAAERMSERGTAVLDFLDRRFAYIGPEEYVRRPILRICKNWEEERTYRRGSDSSWSIEDLEIVTYDDNLGSVDSYRGETMNRRLVSLWLRERDHVLTRYLPSWLQWGFENAFATAVPKRKSLDFREDDWDRDELRERVREDRATLPRELVLLGRSDFFEDGFWDRQREAGALVRFLLSDVAAKNGKTKGVLDEYIRNLKLVADRIDATKPKPPPYSEEDDEPEEEPEEEEERELSDAEREALAEAAKAAREAAEAEEHQILDEVFERTFSSWTERDWEAFEKVYFKSLK